MVTREDCIKIGEISKTHGLQGNVIVTTDSDLLGRYADEPVFLLLDGAPVPFFISEDGLVPRSHSSYIVKFDYVDSLPQAERLLNCEVLLEKALFDEEEAEDPGEDIYGLAGFEVCDQVSGENGKVTDVANYSGNVVLTVFILGKEILLPLSDSFISEVDFTHRQLKVRIPQELIELN